MKLGSLRLKPDRNIRGLNKTEGLVLPSIVSSPGPVSVDVNKVPRNHFRAPCYWKIVVRILSRVKIRSWPRKVLCWLSRRTVSRTKGIYLRILRHFSFTLHLMSSLPRQHFTSTFLLSLHWIYCFPFSWVASLKLKTFWFLSVSLMSTGFCEPRQKLMLHVLTVRLNVEKNSGYRSTSYVFDDGSNSDPV